MRIAYFTDTYLPQVNGVTNTLDKFGIYLKENNIEYRFFAPEYPQAAIADRDDCVNRFRSVSQPCLPRMQVIYAYIRGIKNQGGQVQT